MNSRFLFLVGLCLVLFTGMASAAMNVSAQHAVNPGSTLLVHGTTGTNVNVSVSSSIFDTVSNVSNETTGDFDVYIAILANTSEDVYSILVATNASDSATLFVTVTNISVANIAVLDSPTYKAGTTLSMNVSFLNSSSAPLLDYPAPFVSIFSPMGGEVSTWNSSYLSPTTGSTGSIVYNFSIPTSASGSYALVVKDAVSAVPFIFNVIPGDDGVFFSVVPMQDSTEGQLFPLNQNITLQAKLRYGNGSVIDSASSVVAFINLPDGSSTSVILSNDGDGIYSANFTSASQSGTYTVKAKAIFGATTFQTTSSFDVGSVALEITPNTDKFFKEAEKGGKIAVKPGAEVGFLVKARNLTTGEYLSSSWNGTGNTFNCSNLSLVSVYNMTDSSLVAVSNAGLNTTTSFGQTFCYLNFTAPSSSAVYKLTVNSQQFGVTSDGFFPVQTYMLRITPVSTTAGQDSFQQMFAPGSVAKFKVEAINSSGDVVSGASVTNVGVVKLFNLPTGTSLSASDLAISTDDATDTINVTLPTSLTDAFILSVNATVSSESVVGDTFFFSKYIIGFMRPSSDGDNNNNNQGSEDSKCSGDETFVGNVALASTGQQISNVWLGSTPQLMVQESNGKIVTSCISFQSNFSTDGMLTTTATFDPACNLSGRYFFLANVTYSDDNGGHVDSIPGSFKCSNMKGEVRFGSEQSNQFAISSSGKINVTVGNLKYLNGTNITSGTVEVQGLRVFTSEGFGPPRFLDPAGSLSFDLAGGMAQFQLSPQNFTSGGSLATNWAGGEGFVQGDIVVCDLADTTCNTFESGIPIGSSTEVWADSTDHPASFVLGQNVTVLVNGKANFSAGNFTARFETNGVPGGIQALVYPVKTQDNWNADGDPGFERWELNVTVPSTLQKGGSRLKLTMTNDANGEKISRDIFGSVGGVSVSIPQAGLEFFSPQSQMGPLEDPAFSSALDAQGWNVSWLNSTYGFSQSNMFPSMFCFMPNITVHVFGQNDQYVLVNNTAKLLGIDTDGNGMADNILVRDTTFFNSTYNTSAIRLVNATTVSSRSMGSGIYLWQMFGCGFANMVYANVSSASSGASDSGVNQNTTLPYRIRQGSTPISGVTVNITAIYRTNDEGWDLISELPSNQYSVVSAVTDGNGIAWVTLNVTTSGRYKLFWSINGSINDTATKDSATDISIRSMKTQADLLYTLDNGIQAMTLYNTTAGTNNMCPAGGCIDVYNGSVSSIYGLGAATFAFNTSNMEVVFNINGTNTTCPSAPCLLNSSSYTYDQAHDFSISRVNQSTPAVAIYMKRPTAGDQAFVNSTSTLSVSICAQSIAVSETNENDPITTANVTSVFVREFQPNSPPSTTVLAMYDPISGQQVSTLPVWQTGCVAFRTNKSVGVWSGQGELRANITALIDGQLVNETLHIANVNVQGG